MTTAIPTATKSRTVCHCLRVTECEIRHAVDNRAAESVRDVMEATGAGGGCTACHCTIKRMIAANCQAG